MGEHIERGAAQDLDLGAHVAGEPRAKLQDLPIIETGLAETGVQQAPNRVHVQSPDAAGAEPVESLNGEVALAVARGEESRGGHVDARRARHLGVGLLNGTNILAEAEHVVTRTELDEIRHVVGRQRGRPPGNDGCRDARNQIDATECAFGESGQHFRPCATGGAAAEPKGWQQRFGTAVVHADGLRSDTFKIEWPLCGVDCRITAQRNDWPKGECAHARIAERGEPIEDRDALATNAELREGAVLYRATPAIGRAVGNESGKPIKVSMRVFDEAGLHGCAQRRYVERAAEKALVIFEVDARPRFRERAKSALAQRRARSIGAKREADFEATNRGRRRGSAACARGHYREDSSSDDDGTARERGPREMPASRRFPYTRARPIACASSSSMLRAAGSGNRVMSGSLASRAIAIRASLSRLMRPLDSSRFTTSRLTPAFCDSSCCVSPNARRRIRARRLTASRRLFGV